MFGRIPKNNPNYYLSPHGEDYLQKKATTASVIAGAALAFFLPALVLWITPGIGALLWIREAFEAQVAYALIYICALIGLLACFVLSFFGYKIRKKVMQKSAPTLGFRRSSYNGAFFTAVLLSLLLVFQLVLLVGYHVALSTGYIAEVIAKYELGKAAETDGIGIVVTVFYALSTAASWLYYVYTFRVNRTMQLVTPDKTPTPDAPAVPTKEEADKHRPEKADGDEPPRPTYGLTAEEKKLGEHEFEDEQ